MKKICIIFFISAIAFGGPARSQSFEAQQLLLDVQKLAQLKNILNDLYQGYEIVSNGYEAIKNISEGNFNLHKLFLDGLLAVSPAVRNYKRVADIIDTQLKIVAEYKEASARFKSSALFNPPEIAYMDKVYSNLVGQSTQNIDELQMIITASTLRMSDAERLQAIDRVYSDVQDKLIFLRKFNAGVQGISNARNAKNGDLKVTKGLYAR